mgnify:CR=1 FL=1
MPYRLFHLGSVWLVGTWSGVCLLLVISSALSCWWFIRRNKCFCCPRAVFEEALPNAIVCSIVFLTFVTIVNCVFIFFALQLPNSKLIGMRRTLHSSMRWHHEFTKKEGIFFKRCERGTEMNFLSFSPGFCYRGSNRVKHTNCNCDAVRKHFSH